jgi:acid phosphatase (class A)
MQKRVTLTFVWLTLVVLALAGPLQAREPQSRVYLPAGSVDGAALIGPPPAVGSPKFAQEMTVVLWLQRTRTPEQIAFVRKTLDVERFAPLVAVPLVGVDGIALKQTIDGVIDEVRADYDALKSQYDMPRPFQLNDAVHPVTDPRPVASYPSGHAIRATVYARLLSEIFPGQKKALIELAQQIGYGRVIAGVHYPTDILAGAKLGHAYADVIVEQAAFKQAVKRIRGTLPPSRDSAEEH